MAVLEEFLAEHRIEEVECIVPDLAGIARGKILPAAKFVKGLSGNGLRIPEAVFVQTVTGSYPDEETGVYSPAIQDVYLRPDASTIRIVPWYPDEPTAQVICDAYYLDGTVVPYASRSVLKHVLARYEAKGWQPIVAPELEI